MRRTVPCAAAALVLVAVLAIGCGKGGNGGAAKQPATTADLLQIKDLIAGSGDVAKADDYVSIEYTAWVYQNGAQGAKLASTADNGIPETLALDASANWPRGKMAEGITGMKTGGKRTFVIPSDPQGAAAAQIPAGASVMFEVTLLSIPRVQQQDLVPGNGPEARAGDVIDVNYTGWLSENGNKGKKFDSSLDSGQPLHFQLGAGRVIPGWDIGVEDMRVGGKRQLIIPPELAYGRRGTGGGIIPPNSTLIFDVELLKVEGK